MIKKHLILVLATLFLVVLAAEAKTGKIKFGKYVYYEGEVANKQPEGNGSLVLVSPTDKHNVVATITGQFEGNKIINADITSKLLPTIKIGHNQFITYDLHGDKGKVDNLTFNFSKVAFNMGESEYTMDLKAHVSIANKKWVMIPSSPYRFTLTTNAPVPYWMLIYWNNPLRVDVSAALKNGCLFIGDPLFYIFNEYKYECQTNKFVPLNDNPDYSFRISKDGHFWDGKRKLHDGTIIESNGTNQYMIKNAGMEYHGSLNDPMQPVRQDVTRFEDFKFKTGRLSRNNNNDNIKYLNGETEYDIRDRLKSQGINDDLINSVIAEDITESGAMTKQRKLNEIINSNLAPENSYDIEFIAKSKGLETLVVKIHYDKCNLGYVKGDDDNRVIVLNAKDNSKQISTSDYYLNVAPGYRFSWPKSFITKGYARGDGEPALEAESVNLNDVSYFDDDPGWPGDVRHYMIWVYKPVLEKDGITYGQTKGLYLLGFDNKIKYDLSETFTKGNNNSFKKILPAPKKKKYHERGRVQECGICLGTGQGWQGGICPFCGGKGWYIEHEW